MRVDGFCAATQFDEIRRVAKEAEALGLDAYCTPEITGDPFINLALAATATSRIGLRTAIAVAFPRSPMMVANSAWTLHANSGGRMVLGLGTQVKGHNERRFSVPWVAPAARLTEYVESLRAIWRCWEKKTPLAYEGEHYQFTLMTPEFAPPPSGLPPIPVYLAAVRPAMMEVAGRVGDGVRLHGFATRKYLEEVALPSLEVGLAAAGRPRERFEICGGGFIATGPDEEAVMKRREWVRYRIAFYGSTRTYLPVMEVHGWEDLAAELHRLSKEGRWKEMAARIPDAVLDAFTASATYEQLDRAVAARFGGISDTVELPLEDELASGDGRGRLRGTGSRELPDERLAEAIRRVQALTARHAEGPRWDAS